MSKSEFFKRVKQEANRWLPLRYFRELSVVIIGVAVTFYVSGLITESKERRDLNLYLDAIRTELESNLNNVDSIGIFYDKHLILRELLLDYSESPKEITKDSILQYSQVYNSTNVFSYRKAAYETFINSGAMKTFNDKPLLMDITESYIQLDAFYNAHEKHSELKYHQFAEIYGLIELEKTEKNISILDASMKRLYNFHALNSGLKDKVDKVRSQLEKTLAEL